MNNAREIKTMFGGVALVAKADLVIEKTTINLVKDVIIITIDGAKDKTVIKAKTLKILAVAVPVEASPKLRLMFCAIAEWQNSRQIIKRIVGKINFLAMFVIILLNLQRLAINYRAVVGTK